MFHLSFGFHSSLERTRRLESTRLWRGRVVWIPFIFGEDASFGFHTSLERTRCLESTRLWRGHVLWIPLIFWRGRIVWISLIFGEDALFGVDLSLERTCHLASTSLWGGRVVWRRLVFGEDASFGVDLPLERTCSLVDFGGLPLVVFSSLRLLEYPSLPTLDESTWMWISSSPPRKISPYFWAFLPSLLSEECHLCFLFGFFLVAFWGLGKLTQTSLLGFGWWFSNDGYFFAS